MLLSLRMAGEKHILNTINKKSSLFLVSFEEVRPFFFFFFVRLIYGTPKAIICNPLVITFGYYVCPSFNKSCF